MTHLFPQNEDQELQPKRQLWLQLGGGAPGAGRELASEPGLETPEDLHAADSQEDILKQVGEIFTLTDAEFRERYDMEHVEEVNHNKRMAKFRELMNTFKRRVSDNALAVIHEIQVRDEAIEETEEVVDYAKRLLRDIAAEARDEVGIADTEESKTYDLLIKAIDKMGLKSADLKKTRELNLARTEKEEELALVDDELALLQVDIDAAEAEEQRAIATAKQGREALNTKLNWTVGIGTAVGIGAAFIPAAAGALPLGTIAIGAAITVPILKKLLRAERYPGVWLKYRGIAGRGIIPQLKLDGETKEQIDQRRAEEQAAFDEANAAYTQHTDKLAIKEKAIKRNYDRAKAEHDSMKEILESLTREHAALLVKKSSEPRNAELDGQISAADDNIKEAQRAYDRAKRAFAAMEQVQRMFAINKKYAAVAGVSDDILGRLYQVSLNPELNDKIQELAKKQDSRTAEAQMTLGEMDKTKLGRALRLEQPAQEQVLNYLSQIEFHRPVKKGIAEREFRKPGQEAIYALRETKPELYQALLELATLPPGTRYKTNTIRFMRSRLGGVEEAEALAGLNVINNPQQRARVQAVLAEMSDLTGNEVLQSIFMGEDADEQALNILGDVFNTLANQEWFRNHYRFPLGRHQTERILRAVGQIYTIRRANGALTRSMDSTRADIRELIERENNLGDFMWRMGEIISMDGSLILFNAYSDAVNQLSEKDDFDDDAGAALGYFDGAGNFRQHRLRDHQLGRLSLNLLGPRLSEGPFAHEEEARQILLTMMEISDDEAYQDRHNRALGAEYQLTVALKAIEVSSGPIDHPETGYLTNLKKYMLIENITKAVGEMAEAMGYPQDQPLSNFITRLAQVRRDDGRLYFGDVLRGGEIIRDAGSTVGELKATARLIVQFQDEESDNLSFFDAEGVSEASPDLMGDRILNIINALPAAQNDLKALIMESQYDSTGAKLNRIAAKFGIDVPRRIHPETGAPIQATTDPMGAITADSFENWIKAPGHPRAFYTTMTQLIQRIADDCTAVPYRDGADDIERMDYVTNAVQQVMVQYINHATNADRDAFYSVAERILGRDIRPAGIDVNNDEQMTAWLMEQDDATVEAYLNTLQMIGDRGDGLEYTYLPSEDEVILTLIVEALDAFDDITDAGKRLRLHETPLDREHLQHLLEQAGVSRASRTALEDHASEDALRNALKALLNADDGERLRDLFTAMETDYEVDTTQDPALLIHQNLHEAKKTLRDLNGDLGNVLTHPTDGVAAMRSLQTVLRRDFGCNYFPRVLERYADFQRAIDKLTPAEGAQLNVLLESINDTCTYDPDRQEIAPRDVGNLEEFFNRLNPADTGGVRRVGIQRFMDILNKINGDLPVVNVATLTGNPFPSYVDQLNGRQKRALNMAMSVLDRGYEVYEDTFVPRAVATILGECRAATGLKAEIWNLLSIRPIKPRVLQILNERSGVNFEGDVDMIQQILDKGFTLATGGSIAAALRNFLNHYVPWIENSSETNSLERISQAEHKIKRGLTAIEEIISLRRRRDGGHARQVEQLDNPFIGDRISSTDFVIWSREGEHLEELGMEISKDGDTWKIHNEEIDPSNDQMLKNFALIGHNIAQIEWALLGNDDSMRLVLEGDVIKRISNTHLTPGNVLDPNQIKRLCKKLDWS